MSAQEYLTKKSVIITGASGLLGRSVMGTFLDDGWDVVGLAFSRAHLHKNLVKIDIRDGTSVEKLFNDIKPTVVVHCAAERSPDAVEQKPEETFNLNVTSTKHLSECARNIGAFFIYVSTDYVFDGNNPPYPEDATPNPINKYGESKLAGERASTETNPDAAILRVPVLYGEVEKLSESAVTVLFEKLIDGSSNKQAVMSHYERRYPTHVQDIAKALLLLASKQLQSHDVRGVFHWSGNDCLTKYEMVCHMAQIFDLPMNHIIADAEKPTSGAARPYDAHLKCDRLQQLNPPKPIPFDEGIKNVLAPFAKKL